MRKPSSSAVAWAEDPFGQAARGDARRAQRRVPSAAWILEHPGGSLPAQFSDPADLDAFSRLRNSPEVSHAQLIRAAAARTWQRRAEHPGVVPGGRRGAGQRGVRHGRRLPGDRRLLRRLQLPRAAGGRVRAALRRAGPVLRGPVHEQVRELRRRVVHDPLIARADVSRAGRRRGSST